YVRFGGEIFGPFEKTELDEFVQQLGTSDAVEVRRTDEETWSAVDVEGQPTEDLVFDIEQDDDKTLMSSDMSPEMMDELRSLLDDVPDPATSESAAPSFVPPETQVDSFPSAVVDREADHGSVVEVSLDELLSEESEMPSTRSVKLEELDLDDDKPSMLIASPNKESCSEQRRQITAVSQTPEIQAPNSIGKQRASTSPPELPKAVSNPTRSNPAASTPAAPVKRAEIRAQESALLPPVKPSKDNSGVNSESVSNPTINKRPSSAVSPSEPFQVTSSSNGKVIKIALLVTLIVGGAGSAAVWFQKQKVQKEQTHSGDQLRSLRYVDNASMGSPEKTTAAIEKPVKMPVPKPENTEGRQEKSGEEARKDTKSSPMEVKSAQPALKAEPAKVVSKPPVTTTTVKPKKSYKRKWVRKKTKSVLSRLNRAAIEGVMKKEKSAFTRCGQATGTKLTVSMEILGSGTVRKVQLFDRGRLKQATKKCLISTFKSIVFPKTKTPVNQVRVPFTL
ncbi:MAG: hypothetical protein ACPGQS_07865, partial [Bradymonadia bacterium]